ncbi:MAG TPA: DUF1223 domain-containing protein [Bryobacteraceae bacterium]|nr:DUF1223 domain-containing protein [Bryobacteraceae bacterium]
MITRVILPIFAFAVACGAQMRTPVVVELFTSDGCSSCPPADNLLARLPGMFPDLDVIPLSEHVDYWNQQGWKDRFSAPLFSMRQQDYGRVFGLEQVYTPEMIVNGTTEFNGSDVARARQEIVKAASSERAAATIGRAGSSSTIHLHVEKAPKGVRNIDVFLAITESNLETPVERGENAGRRLRYIGVVRHLSSVGHFDTKKSASYDADARLTLKPEWRAENVKLVMLVQDRSTRKIIGAAEARP